VQDRERTSIQVRRDLVDELEALKREFGAASYDEVIRSLLRERKRLSKSYFGTLPKLKSFRREEIDRFD
jgi:predicted CopG family antitoxin